MERHQTGWPATPCASQPCTLSRAYTGPGTGGVVNAYCYLRVSGKAQVDGDGFDRQLLACEAYAKQHGLEIVNVFREEGVSGTKAMEDRPALLDLMETLKESPGVVIIEKL